LIWLGLFAVPAFAAILLDRWLPAPLAWAVAGFGWGLVPLPHEKSRSWQRIALQSAGGAALIAFGVWMLG
jgi:hypothetical protein